MRAAETGEDLHAGKARHETKLRDFARPCVSQKFTHSLSLICYRPVGQCASLLAVLCDALRAFRRRL